MKLLVAVDTYVPATISGALQMHDLCRELSALGHDVLVVVPQVGKRGTVSEELLDGVNILRVSTPRYKDESYIKRTLVEALLPWYFEKALKRSRWSKTKWEALIWYSPTIFLGAFANKIRRTYGSRTYLVLRDIFPDWAVDMGLLKKGVAYRILKRVEAFQYKQADTIGVQTAANITLVANQLDPCEADKVTVLPNWLSKIEPDSGRYELPPKLAGRSVVVYTGNMGTAQGMQNCLDIADLLSEEADIGFLFIGRGSEAERIREEASRRANVAYKEELPSDQIPSILAQCRLGLIALDHRHNTHNIPGKMLTYLRAGLPVVAAVNPGNDLIALIERERIGFATDCREHVRLASAILKLIRNQEDLQLKAVNARATFFREFEVKSAASAITKALVEDRESSKSHKQERPASTTAG